MWYPLDRRNRSAGLPTQGMGTRLVTLATYSVLREKGAGIEKARTWDRQQLSSGLTA